MRLHLSMVLFAAVFVLVCQGAEAGPIQAQSSQDANGHIQFQFNNTPSVKIAPAGTLATESCPAVAGVSKAGSLRYNSTNKAMEYCDGSNWMRLGASPSCPAGQVITYDSSGAPACLDPTCPVGQMLKKDASGNFVCANIMSNMSCIQKTQIVSTQTNSIACPPEYFVVAGACWRAQKSGSGTWDSGFSVGEWLGTGRDASDRTNFTCRMETWANGAINVHGVVTCCK